jgi:glycosyltransferase involved in cell wall biosynthesis
MIAVTIVILCLAVAACAFVGYNLSVFVSHWVCRMHFPRRKPKPQPELLSIIVPFKSDGAERARAWGWLSVYYTERLTIPFEIIMQYNGEVPFCKTAAVNDAFERCTGDVIVIMDADCYIDVDVLESCASKIRAARKRGERLWFVPYRRFYRLTKDATNQILNLPPHYYALGDPPQRDRYDPLTVGSVSAGHWYGALIQVMPREAFVEVGGMDPRFKGWGGEDISFMHAVDTLYSQHRTSNNPVYHFWHTTIKGTWKATRQWEGQAGPEQNDWLSTRYEEARGDYEMMSELVSRTWRGPDALEWLQQRDV